MMSAAEPARDQPAAAEAPAGRPAAGAGGAAPRGAEEAERIWEARSLFGSLVKVLKNQRVLPADHPSRLGLERELWKQVAIYLEKYDQLKVQVSPRAFLMEKKEVLAEKKRGDSLPFRFFLDGIRELTFRRGLDRDEFNEFLGLLTLQSRSRETLDEDLVTLFWKKEFHHIEHFAIDELYESWDTEESGIDDEERRKLKDLSTRMNEIMSAVSDRVTHGQFRHFLTSEAKEIAHLDEVPLVAEEGTESEAAAEEEVIALDDAQLEELSAELAMLTPDRVIDRVLDIIFRTLPRLDPEESGEDAVNFISHFLEISFRQKNLEQMSRLVAVLNRFGETKVGQPYRPRIAALLEGLGTAENIQRFMGLIDGKYFGGLASIARYLDGLPRDGVRRLVDCYFRVKSREAHKLLRDFLARRTANDLELVELMLDHPEEAVVRDGVAILSVSSQPQALGLLIRAGRHENPRVRMHALVVLAHFQRPLKANLLRDLLLDEVRDLRVGALRQLIALKDNQSLAALRQAVERPEFREYKLEDKELFCRALAELCGEPARPVLRQLSRTWSLLRWGAAAETRRAARQALHLLTRKK